MASNFKSICHTLHEPEYPVMRNSLDRALVLGAQLAIYLSCFLVVAQNLSFDERTRATMLNPSREDANADLPSNRLDGYFKSLALFNQGNFLRANKTLGVTLKLQPKLSPQVEGKLHLLAGRIFRLNQQPVLALAEFNKARELYAQLKDSNGIFETNIDLLEHYRAGVQFKEAQNYVRTLNKLEGRNLNPELRIRFWHRKAALFAETEDSIPNATALLQRSARWADSLKLPWQEATALLDLGYIKWRFHNQNPLPYYRKVEELRTQLGHWRDVASVKTNIIRVLIEKKFYDQALEELDELNKKAAEEKWQITLGEIWELRSLAYEGKGDLAKALSCYREAHEYKMVNLAQQNNDQVAQMIAKIGVQTARNELLEAENKNIRTEEALATERKGRQLMLVVLVLVMIGAASLVYFFFRIRTNNQQLAKQQEVIKKTNNRLQLALEQKNLIYKELHHRVKNNLATLSGLLYLQSRNAESEEAKWALTEARNRIQAMSQLHQGLYQDDAAGAVRLQDYLESLQPSLVAAFQEKARTVQWDIRCTNIQLNFDKAVTLAMVLNEFITNAFKYAFTQGEMGYLGIVGEITSTGWKLEIIDNGPGLPGEFNWKENKSLGTVLIHFLLEELPAGLSYERKKGLSIFTITYAEPEHQSPANTHT